MEGRDGIMRKRTLIIIFFCFWVLAFGDAAGAGTMNEYGFISADRFIRLGKYVDAVDIYQFLSKTARNAQDRAQALLLEGTVQGFFMRGPRAAMACYQKILFLYPESPAAADALFNSAVIYYGQGRFEQARSAFSEYVTTYPYGVRRASADEWLKRGEAKVDDSMIRVLAADHMSRLTIRSGEKIFVQDTITGRRVCPDSPAILIMAEKGGLSINGRMTSCRQFRVWSDTDVVIFNGRGSRGEYIISVTDDGLQAVNHIPVEQYLYGIIPGEMPYTWSEAALMAQAVASRTYALYIREQNRHLPYDVSASVASQVYGGVDAEKPSTTIAVDATQGQVMTFGGNLIAAYFHADSGGHTEDARNVWDVDIPYLKGAPDRFSGKVPGSDWQCYLLFTRMGKFLTQAGKSAGMVRGINILEKSPTGRVLKIEIVTDAGRLEMSGNHFRMNFGSTVIKSTRFQVASKADGVLLTGKGYGHGVGMSQQGAGRMALAGFTYRQILEFYYPGITISDVDIVCHSSYDRFF